MDSRVVIRLLRQAGWELARTSGSHNQFRHATRQGTVTVAHPQKDVPIGTLIAIERKSGVKLRK